MKELININFFEYLLKDFSLDIRLCRSIYYDFTVYGYPESDYYFEMDINFTQVSDRYINMFDIFQGESHKFYSFLN